MLYDLQFGFRENYFTDTCLIHLTDHIKTQTSKGLYTGMIMLDLQNAFDTVDYSILCDKLRAMGIILWNGFNLTYQIECKLLKAMMHTQTFKVVYWAHYCFSVMSMICL